MAQNFDDFSAYANGNIVSVSGGNWTQLAGGNWNSYSVITAAGETGGKVFEIDDTNWGNQSQIFVDEVIGAHSGDFDIYTRMKVETPGSLASDRPVGPCFANTSGDSYALRYGGSGSWDLLYFQGAESWAFIDSGASSHTIVADTYFKVRLQRSGSTIRARIWADGDTEPGTWDLSGTNSTITTGKAGVQVWAFAARPYTFDVVGIGSGGDAAPTSGGGGGSGQPFPPSLHNRVKSTIVRRI